MEKCSFIKSKLTVLIFISLLFKQNYSKTSKIIEVSSTSGLENVDNRIQKHKFTRLCEERIIDPNNLLSTVDMEDLCYLIEKRPEYAMFIRLIPNISGAYDDKYNFSYDKESEDFIQNTCSNYIICSKSIGITIYYSARKIRFVVNKNIETTFNYQFREKILEKITPYLKESKYYRAFFYALSLSLEKIDGNGNKVSSDDHLTAGDIPGLLFLLLIVYMTINCCKEICISNHSLFYPEKLEKIHNHFALLNSLIKNNFRNNSKINEIKVDKCLLCMKDIFFAVNDNGINGSNEIKTLLKFSCKHYFHLDCILKMDNKNQAEKHCLMCDEPTAMLETINQLEANSLGLTHSITEKNITNILGNFNNIYGELSIKSYYSSYERRITQESAGRINIWWIDTYNLEPPVSRNSNFLWGRLGNNDYDDNNGWFVSGNDYGDNDNYGGTGWSVSGNDY